MAAVWKLILLIAVMLMPFGMQPASAAPVRHHAAMPMQHCPEQAPSHGVKGALAECMMACSAALPALDRCEAQPLSMARERVRPALAQHLSDLHPDIATPPPKHS